MVCPEVSSLLGTGVGWTITVSTPGLTLVPSVEVSTAPSPVTSSASKGFRAGGPGGTRPTRPVPSTFGSPSFVPYGFPVVCPYYS